MNERIRMLRKHLGMNQSEFAEFLGVSVSNIQSYETGRRAPSDAFIQLLTAKCHTSESWLRTGEGDMFEPIEREDEIARIADQMLHEVEPSIRNGMHRIVADMTEEELKLFFDCAKRLVDDMDE